MCYASQGTKFINLIKVHMIYKIESLWSALQALQAHCGWEEFEKWLEIAKTLLFVLSGLENPSEHLRNGVGQVFILSFLMSQHKQPPFTLIYPSCRNTYHQRTLQ